MNADLGGAPVNAVETLARFFQAENDRDWKAYRTFLHEDVVWHLHGEGDRTIRGVEEYLRTIRDAYAASDAHFRVEEAHEAACGSRVVVLLVDDSRRFFEESLPPRGVGVSAPRGS